MNYNRSKCFFGSKCCLNNYDLTADHTATKSGSVGGGRTLCVSISGTYEGAKWHNVTLRTVKHLNLPSQDLGAGLLQQSSYLKRLPIQTYVNAAPGLLIGLDHQKLITPIKSHTSAESDLVATKCTLGWTVSGPVGRDMAVRKDTFMANVHTLDGRTSNTTDELLREFFRLDAIGLRKNPTDLFTVEERAAIKQMEEDIEKKWLLRNRTSVAISEVKLTRQPTGSNEPLARPRKTS